MRAVVQQGTVVKANVAGYDKFSLKLGTSLKI
jgi:hypothetical protein